MIIQVVLTLGLLLCLGYAFIQRQKSKLVSVAISVTAVAGIYFVIFPEKTNQLAHLVGVGRGADLVLYCWLVISFVVSLNLQFKIFHLQSAVVELARELSLQRVRTESVDT